MSTLKVPFSSWGYGNVSEKVMADHHDEKASLVDQTVDLEHGTPAWKKHPSRCAPSSLNKKFLVDLLCILLNTVSTVCIVFVNKIIFNDPQLGKCQITTAAWHFAVTAVVLLVATLPPFNLFPRIRVPVKEVLPIAVFFVGFLVLGNLSLALNDISFYQLAKIMTMPTVVALNFLLWGKRISMGILMTVVVSTVGVGMTTSQLAMSNPIGIVIAVGAFVVTALYQLWIGKKIGELNVTAPQLLLNQAPVAVVLLLCILPFIDTMPELSQVQPRALWALFGSGFLASALNLSQFLIIGRTSALTFNVISNAKNIIIISLGWWQAGRVLMFTDLFGASLALGGAFTYSWLVQRQK